MIDQIKATSRKQHSFVVYSAVIRFLHLFSMEGSKRESTLSNTSTGSVEIPGLRREDSNDYSGRPETVDYASTEAQLQEQIGLVSTNRKKIKRLKKNLCILIVFLVDILFSFRKS